MKTLQPILKLTAIFVLVSFSLILVFNLKVLFFQKKVNPGEDYNFAEWGNLGDGNQASLACKYFNGRGVVYRSYWYSPNNVFGRDSCPFILKD